MMSVPWSEKQTALLHALTQLPPDWNTAEEILRQASLSSEAVTAVGLSFAEECFEESVHGPLHPKRLPSGAPMPEFHSQFLYEVTALLLRFGLDPNAIQDEENIMFSMCYITYDLVAADTLALLFAHGGNANLIVAEESLLSRIEFDITFELLNPCDTVSLAALVHLWMILMGYGAKYPDGRKNTNLKLVSSAEPCDLTNLKHHRNYYFGVSDQEGQTLVHLYDRSTFREFLQF